MPRSAEDFRSLFNVSRETLNNMTVYHDLLLKWQNAINLVSGKTINMAWERHFIDSAQISPFIPQDKKIADIGSGAGFPGLVLAIMRPDLNVNLVESDQRKAQFLRTVSRETNANVTIHNDRAEDVLPEIAPDVITARALASLVELLDYAAPCVSKNTDLVMVLLKGAQADGEIEEAGLRYDFAAEKHTSQTDSEAAVLAVSQIKAL